MSGRPVVCRCLSRKGFNRYSISEKESVTIGARKGVFVNALRSFDDKALATLNPRSFAAKLRQYSQPQCHFSYSTVAVAQERESVTQWFTSGGIFYNDMVNVRSLG